MKRALRTGEALADDLGVLVDEGGHDFSYSYDARIVRGAETKIKQKNQQKQALRRYCIFDIKMIS